jgi:predicted dehydrogenase
MADGLSRRQFAQRSLAAASAVSMPLFLPSRLLGREGQTAPSGEIRVGFIGAGVRGRQLMDQVPSPGRVVAITDCYQQRLIDTLKEKGTTWPTYSDYREMFDREQLDAVVVATPDHGRTLPCIRAMLAGLDVYAEKPLTRYVREGRVLVDVARREGRILQVGSQQRSMEINRFCCDLIRNGGIGDLEVVLAVNYTGPRPNADLPEEPTPTGLDWDIWCGPAPLRPYNAKHHTGWMQLRDYSGGEMTNWGAHGIDQIQSALGKSHTGPTELWPVTPGLDGKVSMRYADGVEVRLELPMSGPMGGAVFVGSEAKMEVNRNKFTTNPRDFVRDAPPPEVQGKWEGDGWIARPHVANWLACIQSRELPAADVEIGHRSVSVCHLVNVTRELGRRLRWNPDTEQFIDDPEANALLDRPRRDGYEFPV